MNICVPTTLEEWQSTERDDGPFLLVSLTKEDVPRWVATNKKGQCDSFNTLDGALLFALGLLDTWTPGKDKEAREDAERRRYMYDREGAAIAFLEKIRRELDAKADKAETEG